MHVIRQGRYQQARTRVSLSTILMISLLFSVLFYIYVQMSDFNKTKEIVGVRCLSELASVKYQLNSVTEYKQQMDALIIEIQQDCKFHKEHVKEFSDNYILMKRHLEICEIQSEELEVECKEVKAELRKTKEELAACRKPPG